MDELTCHNCILSFTIKQDHSEGCHKWWENSS